MNAKSKKMRASLPESGSATAEKLLSPRELEVFVLIGMGHTTNEVAGRLKLGVSTVETHRAKIKNKLGLANAPQLVSAATRWVETRNLRLERGVHGS